MDDRPTTSNRALPPGVGRIVAFFVLLVVLIFAVGSMVDAGIRRINTSGFGVWNRIVDGTINAEVVITGSSRALTHYDAPLLQALTGRSVYNIGLNGSQTDMQVARLKSYLANNAPPRMVVHNLDLFSFQVSRGGVYDPGQYVPYLRDPYIYEALQRVNPEIWKSKTLPLYGYVVEDLRFNWVLGLRGLVGFQPAEDHFQGFKPRDTEWTGDFERFRAANPEGVRFSVDPDGIAAMEDLLAVCRKRNIPVLLVYSPEYYEMQLMTSNRGEIFERFGRLAAEPGVHLLDFSKSKVSFDRSNFYNSQHLNVRGAASFTRELAAVLNEHVPTLQQASPSLSQR